MASIHIKHQSLPSFKLCLLRGRTGGENEEVSEGGVNTWPRGCFHVSAVSVISRSVFLSTDA